jgi:dsRNA-specific ribonuclease
LFRDIKVEGPAHAPVFTVAVVGTCGQQVLGDGKGRSKKQACQAAAKVALQNLGLAEQYT